MTLPALPTAAAMTVADVREYGARVVAWAEQVDDVGEVREAKNKWAAITEYVRRTSREGVAEAEAALRRLEVRIGQLLGPREVGGRGKPSTAPEGLSRDDRSDFRNMADHSDVVEQVIAESTDDQPASRRSVLEAIHKPRGEGPRRNPLPQQASDAGWQLRKTVERLERIFADDRFGANKEQVAAHLRGHLTYTVEVCQDLLDQLDTQRNES